MVSPRVLPIRTSERVQYELAPTATGHAWTPTRKAGANITAMVRAMSFLEVREVQDIADAQVRLDKITELGFVSATFEGAAVSLDEIPYMHRQNLAGVIFELSVVGADPFGAAPAAS